jgi:hypothetical protein
MRSATALGLLAAAGCNQIWGLDPVGLEPSDGPDGPPLPRIKLTAQIAKTTANGYADPMTVFGPLDPPPTVQVGPIDGELLPTAYDRATGTVEYPADLVGKPWRLAYQLGGATPREVHWSPPGGTREAPGGHLVEPLLGRAGRRGVPTKSGYRIAPVGSPAQHTSPRVFTTGLWTEAVFSGTFAGATFDYEYSTKAVSLSGPLGAPENQRFDHVLFADFANLSGCRYASGTAMFVAPDHLAAASDDAQPGSKACDHGPDLIGGCWPRGTPSRRETPRRC